MVAHSPFIGMCGPPWRLFDPPWVRPRQIIAAEPAKKKNKMHWDLRNTSRARHLFKSVVFPATQFISLRGASEPLSSPHVPAA